MESCPFCKKQYKLCYIKTHVERVHTHRDDPKYKQLRETSITYQKTLSKEVIRERAKRYCEKHRDKINEKQRESYEANKERRRVYHANYYKEHNTSYYKEYYRKNREQIVQQRSEQRLHEPKVTCPLCKTVYRSDYFKRHKQICLGLEEDVPVVRKKRTMFERTPKPKEVPQLVDMTIKFFDGTEISDRVYLGYHTK